MGNRIELDYRERDMDAIHGTYHDGKIELDAPVSWPDGSRVTVTTEPDSFGMSEADWPTTPEGIAAYIAKLESLEVPEMSDQEWAEWQAAREAAKKFTLAHMEQHIPRFDP